MSQAVWTGALTFGLVHIPVRLYPATEPKDVRFHLYDRRTGKRVRNERVVRAEEFPTFEPEPESAFSVELREEPSGVEPKFATGTSSGVEVVGPADIVRGLELPSGDLVTVSDDELAAIAPERSRTIEIEEFVRLAEVDPVFFEKSYYLAPARGVGGEKPYALLLRAMQAAGMVGIGRFVLRTRPHLVAIRPVQSALALETLFFGDEVREPDEQFGLANVTISERELKTAQQLIGAMANAWNPSAHADVYREELLDLLRRKPKAQLAEFADTGAENAPGDLMAALKASVEAAKKKTRADRPRRTG